MDVDSFQTTFQHETAAKDQNNFLIGAYLIVFRHTSCLSCLMQSEFIYRLY
jgi:hypothetical protein